MDENSTDTTPLSHEHPKVRALALALLVIVSSGFGFLGGWFGGQRSNQQPSSFQTERVILEGQSELISTIAREVGDSVVSIVVTRGGLFGSAQAAGTGIVLTEDGLIVTNRHVVPAGTTAVTVTLADGTEYQDVQVVGRTSDSDSLDVAFLKINDTSGRKLKAATLGDSTAMQVGDPVIAIGNTLGQFHNTVTSGIISGHGRSIETASVNGFGVDSLENLFQTDAAINEGNSGGPLVNINGEVIGINTAVAAGDVQGVGFAIPINDVSGLIASVKEKGVLERPFLGVMYVSLTNDLAKTYGLTINRGAYIVPSVIAGSAGIIAGGPAEQAGVREGDIITKIDDVAIDQNNSLASLVNKRRVGDKVVLTIVRDGQERTIEVLLAAAPVN